MLLLPIQMYGQQQGLGTTDSNKILSEFGKSAYKMMMDAQNPASVPTNNAPDYFDQNPYELDKDSSGQFYIDNTGNPIDRDTYNYLYQDYLNQQNEAQKDMNPDNYNIGGILDYLQFYKR